MGVLPVPWRAAVVSTKQLIHLDHLPARNSVCPVCQGASLPALQCRNAWKKLGLPWGGVHCPLLAGGCHCTCQT